MSSGAIVAKALNSTLGTSDFKGIDQIIKELFTFAYNEGDPEIFIYDKGDSVQDRLVMTQNMPFVLDAPGVLLLDLSCSIEAYANVVSNTSTPIKITLYEDENVIFEEDKTVILNSPSSSSTTDVETIKTSIKRNFDKNKKYRFEIEVTDTSNKSNYKRFVENSFALSALGHIQIGNIFVKTVEDNI